ncbi:MAG: InlB B-repeat-containing protein [Clostridiales bacterium]|nr:InlB B-repeat-containing protein [Clostridiales bacterium]
MKAKRFSALLLALLITFSLPFSFAGAAGPVVSAGNVTGINGKTADVPINISGNPGIVSIKLSVSYDSDYLQLVSASKGTVFGTVTPTFSQNLADNPYVITFTDGTATENHSSDGALVNLKFKLLKEGKTDLSVTFSSAKNKDLQKVNFTTQAGSVTINPAPVIHTVTFNTNGHGSSPANQRIEHGQTATEPTALVVEGYTFGGWFSDTACDYKYNFASPVNSDLVLYAKWTINSYTVSFNMNGHGTAPASQSVEYGKTAAEPTAPVVEGYTFGGWFTDAACKSGYNFSLPVNSDLVLYAKWTLDTANTVISVAGAKKIDWRTKVTIKATASNIPTDRGYKLLIVADGKTYTGEATGENTMEVTAQIGEIKKDITYSVKVVDSKGNVAKDGAGNNLTKEGGKITVNKGFFKKLAAFFKGLFKKLPSTTVKP